MGAEESQTYAECPAECEQLRAAGIPFLSNAENNNFVSAGDVTVTVGFTENRLIMFRNKTYREF